MTPTEGMAQARSAPSKKDTGDRTAHDPYDTYPICLGRHGFYVLDKEIVA